MVCFPASPYLEPARSLCMTAARRDRGPFGAADRR